MDRLEHESSYRGEAVVKNRSAQRLSLCGCGAIGSRLADLLVAQGYSNLVLIDRERVERANLGTQNFEIKDVGNMKALQTHARLVSRFGVVMTTPCSKALTEANAKKWLSGSSLVIDAFDNAESRKLVKDFCSQNSIPCVHAGMSNDGFGEVEWNENYQVPSSRSDAEAPCDYPLASNLVSFTVTLVAEVINSFFDHKKKRSAHFTLRDLKITVME